MDEAKAKSIIQEHLVGLYLRLNGYFKTGLIIHSEVKGRNITEIDNISIRFPKHTQPEREVESSKFLEIPENNIDILISEVKSEKLEFNPALIYSKSKDTWGKILKWIGIFSDEEINRIIPKIINCIKNYKKYNGKFLMVEFKSKLFESKLGFGDGYIRPTIFLPEIYDLGKNSIKYVHGKELLGYVWKCLCPSEDRDECSITYDYKLWGTEYAPIVQIFKKYKKENNKITKIDILYDELLELYKNHYSVLLKKK